MLVDSFAPIVLFVYKRLSHTKRILDSLSTNKESNNSILFIYSDGPKSNASEEEKKAIETVRKLVHAERRFKEVIVIESEKNKGLSSSVIEGVTNVVNSYGRVIVLEDDLVVCPFFLSFMNQALRRYEGNPRVGQIGACNLFACGKNFPASFFIPLPDCLGWGTWKDKWQHFNPESGELLKQLRERKLIHKFNGYGSYPMEKLLIQQMNGTVSSWAVQWTATSILKGWLTLYPNPSLTNHIESREATHAAINYTPPLMFSEPVLADIKIEERPEVIRAMKRWYSGYGDYEGNLKPFFWIRKIQNIYLSAKLFCFQIIQVLRRIP